MAHVFRVCLTVRHVFGIDDPQVLAAALLHDTIEDTTTDCDDLIDHFGTDVARWVVALTKDMRLAGDEKEATYVKVIAAAEWQVKLCKLADIYDNLGDSKQLSPEGRRKTAARSRLYLDAIRIGATPEIATALRLVEERLAALAASEGPPLAATC